VIGFLLSHIRLIAHNVAMINITKIAARLGLSVAALMQLAKL
jgi:hypothetical protein